MRDRPTKDEFLANVSKHELTIHCDDGIHRHLTLRNPETYNRCFHITTWPGYLAISGDMGTFVFARLRDMFEFFRGEGINTGYWAEKLQATDKGGGHIKFSLDMYHDALRNDFRGWHFDGWRQMRAAWAEVVEEIWNPESLHDAIDGALGYRCSITGNDFQDFWDHSLEDYTYHYVWCCLAIQWAIDKYDARSVADNDNADSIANAA